MSDVQPDHADALLALRGRLPPELHDVVAAVVQPLLAEVEQLRRDASRQRIDEARKTRAVVRYTIWRNVIASMIDVHLTEPSVERDEDGEITDGALQRLLGARLGLKMGLTGGWSPATPCPQRPCTGGPNGKGPCGRPSIVVARDARGLEWFACAEHTEGRGFEFVTHWFIRRGLSFPPTDASTTSDVADIVDTVHRRLFGESPSSEGE